LQKRKIKNLAYTHEEIEKPKATEKHRKKKTPRRQQNIYSEALLSKNKQENARETMAQPKLRRSTTSLDVSETGSNTVDCQMTF